MMTRRWKLAAVYLCAFGLGLASASPYAPVATSAQEAPSAVTPGAVGGAFDLVRPVAALPLPMSTADMAATVGAEWPSWGDIFGFLTGVALDLLIIYGFLWLCTRDNVNCP